MRLFVIIFSAGYSSRFRNSYKLYKELPKPLIPIYNKKLIDLHLYNLLSLRNINIKSLKIYVNLHYKAFEIFSYISSFYEEYIKKGIINFLFEPNLLGHIKTIDKLKSYILNSDLFFILNCDSFIGKFYNYLDIVLEVLINNKVNNLIFVSDKRISQDKKTYTHFEFKDCFTFKYKNKLIKISKVNDIYKNEVSFREYITLYIGFSFFRINRKFNNILLSRDFKELNFIDFLKKLELYSLKIPYFFEITEVKDYLDFLNYYLFYYKYY